MIDTTGMITVAEAAKRLNLSIEQVRRKLREGKLKGQRIGNQWFVEEGTLPEGREREKGRLIPRELLEEIDRTREAFFRRNGIVFDAVALVNEVREEDFGDK
jgi:excisionase family DNA binding protein